MDSTRGLWKASVSRLSQARIERFLKLETYLTKYQYLTEQVHHIEIRLDAQPLDAQPLLPVPI